MVDRNSLDILSLKKSLGQLGVSKTEACQGFFSSGVDSNFRVGRNIFIRGRIVPEACEQIFPLP